MRRRLLLSMTLTSRALTRPTYRVAPPLVVARMVPSVPTAQPWVASLKATALRYALLPELCGLQVAPPPVVARMTPALPTAQPWVASLKATAPRSALLPELCGLQAPPPLVDSESLRSSIGTKAAAMTPARTTNAATAIRTIAQAGKPLLPCAGCVSVSGWAVGTAVSYTHLRAHETRHDLVCRLLLE